MSYVYLEEASECPLKSEKLCLAMSGSNRENQGKIQTGQTLVLWLLPGLCQGMDMAIIKPPGNSRCRAWADTQEMPHSALSIDTVKSKLVPILGISDATECAFLSVLQSQASSSRAL